MSNISVLVNQLTRIEEETSSDPELQSEINTIALSISTFMQSVLDKKNANNASGACDNPKLKQKTLDSWIQKSSNSSKVTELSNSSTKKSDPTASGSKEVASCNSSEHLFEKNVVDNTEIANSNNSVAVTDSVNQTEITNANGSQEKEHMTSPILRSSQSTESLGDLKKNEEIKESGFSKFNGVDFSKDVMVVIRRTSLEEYEQSLVEVEVVTELSDVPFSPAASCTEQVSDGTLCNVSSANGNKSNKLHNSKVDQSTSEEECSPVVRSYNLRRKKNFSTIEKGQNESIKKQRHKSNAAIVSDHNCEPELKTCATEEVHDGTKSGLCNLSQRSSRRTRRNKSQDEKDPGTTLINKDKNSIVSKPTLKSEKNAKTERLVKEISLCENETDKIDVIESVNTSLDVDTNLCHNETQIKNESTNLGMPKCKNSSSKKGINYKIKETVASSDKLLSLNSVSMGKNKDILTGSDGSLKIETWTMHKESSKSEHNILTSESTVTSPENEHCMLPLQNGEAPKSEYCVISSVEEHDAYHRLNEACASIGLNIDDIFQMKEIQALMETREFKSDAVLFFGTCKTPTEEKIMPVVHMHRSKKELWETLCNIKNDALNLEE